MNKNLYHLIIYTPLDHGDAVRDALADAGAGKIGNYEACSFSSRGIGRFRGNDESNPHIGKAGEPEEIEEERIEAIVDQEHLKAAIDAVVAVHPYEQPAIHVLPMLDYRSI